MRFGAAPNCTGGQDICLSPEEFAKDADRVARFQREAIHGDLDIRTKLSDNPEMRGSEFLRRLRRYARLKGMTCQFVPERGKGGPWNHSIWIIGERLFEI